MVRALGASRRRWAARRLAWLLGFVALGLLAAGPAQATPQYATQTGKPCEYCHQAGLGTDSNLNVVGLDFRNGGYRLSAEPTTTSTTKTTPAGGATGSTNAAGGGMGGASGGTNVMGGAGSGSTGGAGDGAQLVGPDGGTTPTPGSTGGDAGTLGPRSLVQLPWLLRDLLLWMHLVAVVAWLGAIIFVHVIQTPRVAGQGIPRHYLYLAWPSIAAIALSGTLLTLDDITGFSQLTDSRWGTLLLVKIFIYLVLVAVATTATFVLSPRLARQSESEDDQFTKLHERAKAAGVVTASYDGVVYDLTESRIWRSGRHARRHAAWTDLSGQIAEAPHGLEVLERFPVVEGAKPPAFPAQRVFVVFAYGNLALVFLILLVVAIWR